MIWNDLLCLAFIIDLFIEMYLVGKKNWLNKKYKLFNKKWTSNIIYNYFIYFTN